MRPTLRFLDDALTRQIVSEAIDVLSTLGFEVNDREVLSLLSDHGARVDVERRRAVLTVEIIEKAIRSAPASFRLYDVLGNEAHRFSGHTVCFAPGSTALHVLDGRTRQIRKPSTRDYVAHAKVIGQLGHIALQSTAMIPADVPVEISDSYRLLLSLLYCEKPVVTGAFSVESFCTRDQVAWQRARRIRADPCRVMCPLRSVLSPVSSLQGTSPVYAPTLRRLENRLRSPISDR